ncbi:MAG TPA: pyridoxal-dependent decarboxylase, partial [Solirubrobacteraceae bacterium]|nr:pyridoxal-dependent decarboxylase [Solirubrobacteraceae bacterium]
VVATAGTTLTGAVDPIAAVADVCARHGTWLHVDGAYGLPAAAAPSAARLFDGLSRADSVTLDAHKWLGVPKSCSVVLVRHAGALGAAFGHRETYMLGGEDRTHAVETTLEYSRPFRSLKLWLALRALGAAEYRSGIERTLGHARALAALVEADPAFELLNRPQLSTVCFRHRPAGKPAADLDAHNLLLARAMQEDGRVYLAPALVDGRTCLRACFVNFRTKAEQVAVILDVARELGARA